ncbi:hypothetical protein JDN40_01845 [Rhodomicrobium vannielii ATCC 17100]|uniref:hypothetical protein n=1 Tax=Rhodomicrobium vannielii TaxID=1069 RepID=UPI00191AAE43|nr:hypothetical protein [Rhodomicrobium vannielii]MBJ7532860.1 hypothetical protein [Rhodomicrobium vannielii ATCC 17100]
MFILSILNKAAGCVAGLFLFFGLVYLIIDNIFDSKPGFCYERSSYLSNLELLHKALESNTRFYGLRRNVEISDAVYDFINRNKNCCNLYCDDSSRARKNPASLIEKNRCNRVHVHISAYGYSTYLALDACGYRMEGGSIKDG